MRGRAGARFVVPLTLSILSAGLTVANAGDWQPELVTPADQSFYGPSTAYRFLIPADVPVEELQRLRLELDNFDVTAFIQRDGEYAIFTPPQPLDHGVHELRVYEYLADGSRVERGQWQVEVRNSARFREAAAQTQMNLSVSGRIAEDELGSPVPDRGQAQGGLSLAGKLADATWRTTASGNFIYNSQLEQTLGERQFDMADFLFSAERGAARASIGHHSIASNSLVMSDFNRRGVSADYSLAALRARVSGFAMRTEPVTGFRYGLGAGNPRHRTSGMVLTHDAFAADPERLQLSMVYLDGQGGAVGEGEGGDADTSDGRAASLIATSRLLDQRLQLRGEVAYTRYRFEDTLVAVDSESDRGLSLLAAYTGEDIALGELPLGWSIGAEYTRLGTFFASPANPGLAADRNLMRGFGGVNRGAWSASLQLAREHDNVEDFAEIPRLRTDYVTLSTSYAPVQETPPQGLMKLFAAPAYNLVLQETRLKHTRTPVEFAGTLTDQQTDVVYAGALFTPGPWSWDIGHTYSRFDDAAGAQSDNTNQLTDIGLSLPIGDRVSLLPRLQWNTLREKDSGNRTRTLTAMLGASVMLIPDKLDAALNLTRSRDWDSDDTIDNRLDTVDVSLIWTVQPPRANRPGLQVFFAGNYFGNDSDSGMGLATPDPYQVFLGINIGWPTSH